MWRGVLRLLSAVTKVDLTTTKARSGAAQAADASAPEAPNVDENFPPAVPEEEDEPSTESAQGDPEPSPLSATETRPAATQHLNSTEEPRLVIENPRHSGATVRYLVDGEMESLRPGESQSLRIGVSRVLFHRGGAFGNAEEVLREGTYQFRATQQGWTLTR
jgi:hypothetical protein